MAAASGLIPADLREAWTSATALALDGVRRSIDRAGDVARIRLHGDCHGGNVLWTDDGPHFVDFDDSRMGPAVQDLWMLLSGDRASMTGQLADVLAGYEDFREFDPRELHLVEALRTLRLMHYAGLDRPALGRSGVSGRVSVVRDAALLAGPYTGTTRADRGDGRGAARARC